MIYKNSEINNQTFTESEIETLKNIAKENKIFDSENTKIKSKEEVFFKNERVDKDSDSVDKFSEKLAKFKIFIKQFPEKFSNDNQEMTKFYLSNFLN